MKKNQKGFGVVEVLIVLVVVSLIGGAGWYVWKAKNKSTPTQDNAQSQEQSNSEADPYAGASWNTYDNGTVSLQYPSNWKIDYDPENDTGYVSFTSPADTSIKLFNHNRPYENVRLEFGVVPLPPWKSGGRDNCADNCTVYGVLPITTNKNLVGAKLVFSDDAGGGGYVRSLSIVDDPNVKVGSEDFRLGINIGGKIRVVSANIIYREPAETTDISLGYIGNLDDFKKAPSYLEMLRIIDTLNVR